MDAIEVRVLPFARAREACGGGSFLVHLAEGATVADCLAQLRRQHPELGALGAGLLVALNERYAGPAEALTHGDTVALIPPVSGG